MEVGLTENAISKEFGHFQIARTGYFDADNTSSQHLIPEEEFRILEELLYDMDEVDYVNLRLHIVGIIGNMGGSTIFAGICGQPESEILMTPTVTKGKPISSNDPTGIIIGASMAEKLNVEVGSNLLLFFSSDSGAQEAINVTIRGLYKGMMKEQENMIIHIPLESAWDLMLERKVHRILVFCKIKMIWPRQWKRSARLSPIMTWILRSNPGMNWRCIINRLSACSPACCW
jgi:putative ABC transport system permease protein